MKENKKISKMMHDIASPVQVIYPDGTESRGYVPRDINIGGGDYLGFNFCMTCGKMVGEFPIEIPE